MVHETISSGLRAIPIKFKNMSYFLRGETKILTIVYSMSFLFNLYYILPLVIILTNNLI